MMYRRFDTLGGARFLLLLCLIVGATLGVRAENYPFKRFTTADGLSQNSVFNLRRDSRGFLWFCTGDGLSRFDGARFVNYTMMDGLPYASINDLLERRDGSYWVATNGGGVARFLTDEELAKLPKEQAGNRFRVYQVGTSAMSNRVNRLIEDRDGRLWATTDEGVYSLEGERFQPVPVHYARSGLWGEPVADRWGCLWFYGTSYGGYERLLVRRLPDGRFVRYFVGDGPRTGNYYRMVPDRNGCLWLSGSNETVDHPERQAVHVFVPERPEDVTTDTVTIPVVSVQEFPKLLAGERLVPPDRPGTAVGIWGGSAGPITALGCFSDGHIWFFTAKSAIEFDGATFRTYSEAEGFSPGFVACVTEDSDGNIWFGERDGSGALRLTRNGCVTFSTADGLSSSVIAKMFEAETGEFWAMAKTGKFHRFDNGRFSNGFIPAALRRDSGTLEVTDMLRDHAGEWWMGTNDGLYRFPAVPFEKLESAVPTGVYTMRDGIGHPVVKRICEDRAGNIWIGGPVNLQKWNRATGKIESDPAVATLPKTEISSFYVAPGGTLWITFFEGGLARVKNGKADFRTVADGLPKGRTYAPCPDRKGRLWIPTTSGGAARIDDPEAENIVFRTFTQKDGLSADVVGKIIEDRRGRLFFLTGRGVDQLDPETDRFRHFLEGDGLPYFIYDGFVDRQENLWLSSRNGLARLSSRPERIEPPRVFVGGIKIAGTNFPFSDIGKTEVVLPELAASRNTLDLVFVGVHFVASDPLLIQYRINDGDWSGPTAQRTFTFANLKPGRYRITVRGVTSTGIPSRNEAVVAFSLLPPIYLRWWVLALGAAAVGLALYGFYRYRIRRLLELERIRMRIAADLHDDIGSNLALIAGLGEMMSRQPVTTEDRLAERLTLIAATSRRSMDAMSDIVWAVNPKKDTLTDLTLRMRRFAEDTLLARDIEFDFIAPEASRNWAVSAEIRREVHLIFKESVNNAARHADCGKVSIETGVASGHLILVIRDDGRGYDATTVEAGNGLASMHHRAEKIGGRLVVTSSPGAGTTVTLRVPLRRF